MDIDMEPTLCQSLEKETLNPGPLLQRSLGYKPKETIADPVRLGLGPNQNSTPHAAPARCGTAVAGAAAATAASAAAAHDAAAA